MALLFMIANPSARRQRQIQLSHRLHDGDVKRNANWEALLNARRNRGRGATGLESIIHRNKNDKENSLQLQCRYQRS